MGVKHGKAAVRKVRELYGEEITDEMVPLIMFEGFSPEVYYDTKGVPTVGVGQTGSYAGLSFPETFNRKQRQLRSMVDNYDALPLKVRQALMVAHYRGDWWGSPATRKLFTEKDYLAAAKEFLDNDDYRSSVIEGTGVAKRMEWVAKQMAALATT